MNNRILGTIAMICAPAMLIDTLIFRGEQNTVSIAITGAIFMAGWICSNIGMQRMQAAGTGKWGRAVLMIQLGGLVLAFSLVFFEMLDVAGLIAGDNIIYIAVDAFWPLSMLWMLVVGVSVIVAKRLSGWQRFIPVLCPLWLLVAIPGSIALGQVGANLAGFGYAAVLWLLLGYIVRESSEQPAPATGPAVAG